MLDAESVERGGQRLGMIEIDRRAQRRLELAAIRLEDRRAAVEKKLRYFGSTTIGIPRDRATRIAPSITLGTSTPLL